MITLGTWLSVIVSTVVNPLTVLIEIGEFGKLEIRFEVVSIDPAVVSVLIEVVAVRWLLSFDWLVVAATLGPAVDEVVKNVSKVAGIIER